MKQSRLMSMVEAATNVVVGYVLAIATQIVVFPWFGIETGLAEHMTIGLAFVGVSLARGYLLRRLFERLRGWFEEHVGEPEPGGIYTCEPRMAQDILQAAARDLLSWQ
jgi:hypothetical protein